MLKQILSLPPMLADIAVYILTGVLPIEPEIHIRALNLFNNICHQSESSVEKMLAKRQLRLKGNDSSSWFIAIKIILRKYDLLEAVWYLDNPVKKSIWTALIKKTVYKYWCKSIADMKPLYSGLQYLSYENLGNGKTHPIFKVNCHSPVDIVRMPVKLKLLTEQKNKNVQKRDRPKMPIMHKGSRKRRTLLTQM